LKRFAISATFCQVKKAGSLLIGEVDIHRGMNTINRTIQHSRRQRPRLSEMINNPARFKYLGDFKYYVAKRFAHG
jgi:hypothetical protein